MGQQNFRHFKLTAIATILFYSKSFDCIDMINRSVILEQQSPEYKIANRTSKPTQRTPKKKDLKNIIELTEQHQTNSNVNDQIIKEDDEVIDSQAGPWFYRLFRCCFNIWNIVKSPTPKWKYDIDEKDFEYYLDKIKYSKQKIKPLIPPQKENRKILVLDLDQTLIYTTFNRRQKYDFQSDIQLKGKKCKIYTSKRFGLQSFLFQMSKIYQLIIYTASQKDYANIIIDAIDPKKRISHRLYREHCIVINKINFLKNIKLLGRNQQDILIVDDNILGGILQPDNYYKIQSFKGNQKDRQLLRLGDFLKYLNKQPKITPVQFYRNQFQQMQIRLQDKIQKKIDVEKIVKIVEVDNNFRDLTNILPHDNNNNYVRRKREYYHQKKNSQVQNLAKELEEEQAETTASQLICRL